jgi:hypothetical protein
VVAIETVRILEATVSPLPRGTCPACHRDVALRVGGLVREHRVYLSQLDQDPTTHLGRLTVCEGSGRPAWSPETVDLVAPETVATSGTAIPDGACKTVAAAASDPSEPVNLFATDPSSSPGHPFPGHCSEHPALELVTHHQAGLRWYGFEDPQTVCPSSDHGQRDQDRCRWCGETVADPDRPTWSRSPRRAYCKPHHRLLAFRARQADPS